MDIINKKRHFFRIELAEKYGVAEAIMLNHLIYWVASNSMKNTNYHEGRFWTYNSVSRFSEFFSYWTESQIARILKSLVKKGVIIEGNFNKIKYDRTKWYALNDEKYFLENYNPVDEIEKWNSL